MAPSDPRSVCSLQQQTAGKSLPCYEASGMEKLAGLEDPVACILSMLGASAEDLKACYCVSRWLRVFVRSYTCCPLRSPWWLPDGLVHAILIAAFSFCSPLSMLRAGCVCRSWRASVMSRAAWRSVRLTFGWGRDAEMQSLLRAMRKVAMRHGLASLPEDPPPVAVAGGSVSSIDGNFCSGAGSKQLAVAFHQLPRLRSAPCSPISRVDACLSGTGSMDLPSFSSSRTRAQSVPAGFICAHTGGSPYIVACRLCKALNGSLDGSSRASGRSQHMRSSLAALPSLSSPSPLLLCNHSDLVADDECSSKVANTSVWLLQHEEARREGDPIRRAFCRYLSKHSHELRGRSVLEINAGSGLVGLFVAQYAKSVTVTTPSELGCRLVRFNASLQACFRKGSLPARQTWSRAVSSQARRSLSLIGSHGPVPVHVYTLSDTKEGVEELARQWQWDSGTGMRALKRDLLAPKFEVLLVAGLEKQGGAAIAAGTSPSMRGISPEGLLQLASSLLVKGGLLIAAADSRQDAALSALSQLSWQSSLSVELDEHMSDPLDGNIRILSLRS